MRQSDYFAIRCEPDLRDAVQQIAGRGGFSRAVRTALHAYIEGHRGQQLEPAQSGRHGTQRQRAPGLSPKETVVG